MQETERILVGHPRELVDIFKSVFITEAFIGKHTGHYLYMSKDLICITLGHTNRIQTSILNKIQNFTFTYSISDHEYFSSVLRFFLWKYGKTLIHPLFLKSRAGRSKTTG